MTKGERVIAVSKFVSEHMQRDYKVPLRKIRIIPRGVDMEYFNPGSVSDERVRQLREKWGLKEENRQIVLMPGRITRWKGQEFLLRALSRMEEAPPYYCIIAGESFRHPKYHSELLKQIIQSGLDKKVKIVEAIDDMPAAYKLADVVVSASQRPEAFGRVAIEAQAMGKPVVVTSIGGSKETVVNGTTGRWVDPTFTNEMSDGIRKGISLSDTQKNNIAQVNRQHIMDNFSLEQMCEKTLAVYDEILSS